MFALWVIEHLDVVENILPGTVSGFVGSAPDTFTLQEVEEAFGNRVIVAVPSAAHAVFKIMLLQERCPVHAGELGALVRVDQNLAFGLSAPYGHEQSLQNQISGLAALNGPANNTPRIEINDNSQTGKALVGFDIGDVCDPGRIRCRNIKLTIQSVIDSK